MVKVQHHDTGIMLQLILQRHLALAGVQRARNSGKRQEIRLDIPAFALILLIPNHLQFRNVSGTQTEEIRQQNLLRISNAHMIFPGLNLLRAPLRHIRVLLLKK